MKSKKFSSIEERNGLYILNKDYRHFWIIGPQNHFPNLITRCNDNTPIPDFGDYELYWEEYPGDENDIVLGENKVVIRFQETYTFDPDFQETYTFEPEWNLCHALNRIHSIKRIQSISRFMYEALHLEVIFTPFSMEYPDITIPEEDFSDMKEMICGDDLMIYPIQYSNCGDAFVLSASTANLIRSKLLKWSIDFHYSEDYHTTFDQNGKYNLIDLCYYLPLTIELLHAIKKPIDPDDFYISLELEYEFPEYRWKTSRIFDGSYPDRYRDTLSIVNIPYFSFYDTIAYILLVNIQKDFFKNNV